MRLRLGMLDQEFFLTISTGGADLHRLVQEELRGVLDARYVERFGQARFFFRANVEQVPLEKFEALHAPEKIYAVVLRQATAELAPRLARLAGTEAEEALAAIIAACEGWPQALATWRTFARRALGKDPSTLPRTFRVTGKRAGNLMAHLSSNGISEVVGETIAERHGWQVALRGFDIEVVVHLNDEFLLVALPLLERTSARQTNFALPGLSQPVAWAMAKSAGITPGEVVVDPMCGSGIILLEAAQCWGNAFYLGFDCDASQLARSDCNLQLLSGRIRTAVALACGDATRLPLPDASCDAVLCDLPFGKLYGSEEDNERLYPAALAEFRRILSPSTGRVVLLTNKANSQKLVDAFLAAADSWVVTCRRRLTLGFMEAVLFLAMVRPAAGGVPCAEEAEASQPLAMPPESMRLPWEDGRGRAKWSSFKALARPPLQPCMGA